MSLEGHKPEANPESSPSLRSIQDKLGITRYDLRPHITALIDDPHVDIDAPKKVCSAALEALLIDEVWQDIRNWIDAHQDVQGFAETNIPVVIPGNYSPQTELRFPQHSQDMHIWPLSQDEYADNANMSCQCFTRDVMQFHLLQWEMKIKERLREQGEPELPAEVWYTRYIEEARSSRKILKEFSNPATAKMYFGFGFGQSMFWRMPDSSHEIVMPKIALQHLVVIEQIEKILREAGESQALSLVGERSVLSQDFLHRLDEQVPQMQQELTRGQQGCDNVNFDAIATGCPAVYTESFSETGKWIRDIRADQQKILSRRQP